MNARKSTIKKPLSKKGKSPKKTAQWDLYLFVAGMSPRSQDAIANIRQLCQAHLLGRYRLEVIDIYQHPLSASVNQILAVPTLIKKLPPPLRKFVGDMTKTEKILAGLDLRIQEKKE
ncbi:MAG: circadian clock KaiB family protein [Chitinivibrionales bacterium]|nr:circadian clock KaiB family protein [Chitinivibrionales bacterium]